MRCPYCGSQNPDRVEYCARCGRDVSARPPIATSRPQPTHMPPPQQQRPTYPGPQQQPPQQRPVYPPAQPPQQPQEWSVYPPSQSPQQQRSVQPPQQYRPVQTLQPQQQRRRERAPQPAPAPIKPQPVRPAIVADTDVLVPANYPPRTMDQLRDLEKLALPYIKLDETSEVGKKRIVRIVYQACHPWQQMATLLKASQEYQNAKFDTLILRGLLDQPGAIALYDYNNGQLILDRNVRLGSQIQTRYQISTGSGIDVDSVRVVLAE